MRHAFTIDQKEWELFEDPEKLTRQVVKLIFFVCYLHFAHFLFYETYFYRSLSSVFYGTPGTKHQLHHSIDRSPEYLFESFDEIPVVGTESIVPKSGQKLKSRAEEHDCGIELRSPNKIQISGAKNSAHG